MKTPFDIIICGLGPTGLEAAATLSRIAPSTARILALEEQAEIGFEHPLCYWSFQAQQAGLMGLEQQSYDGFRTSINGKDERLHDILSFLLDNQAYVKDRLKASRSVTVVTGCRVRRSWHQPDHVVLETDLGRVRAKVVIDASGPASPLAKEAEIAPKPDPVISSIQRVVKTPPDSESSRLLMDLLPTGDNQGLTYFSTFPVKDNLHCILSTWSFEAADQSILKERLDEQLHKRNIVGAVSFEKTTYRRSGSLRPLHRGRLLFTGAAGGLGVPWTGDGLITGIRSAQKAVHAALGAIENRQKSSDPLRKIAGYDRLVHDGLFGITFRFQDLGKNMILKMYAEEIERFYSVFYNLPDELLRDFLGCSVSLRRIGYLMIHFWKNYRIEEIPWHAAFGGGTSALAQYARIR